VIGIDWVAVAVLGVAWVISNVRAIPISVRHWVFAIACFFVAIAAAIGVQYVTRAIKAGSTSASPKE
jgi:hypothetical protein